MTRPAPFLGRAAAPGTSQTATPPLRASGCRCRSATSPRRPCSWPDRSLGPLCRRKVSLPRLLGSASQRDSAARSPQRATPWCTRCQVEEHSKGCTPSNAGGIVLLPPRMVLAGAAI